MSRKDFFRHRRRSTSFSEKEILALAIHLEENTQRSCISYAEVLLKIDSELSALLEKLASTAQLRREKLTSLFVERFGPSVPLIPLERWPGFARKGTAFALWQRPSLGNTHDFVQRLSLEELYTQLLLSKDQAAHFYYEAAQKLTQASARLCFNDFAHGEKTAKKQIAAIRKEDTVAKQKETVQRQTLLTWIQPGLAGLMDGSVSTLAPIFAAAFATGDTRSTFLVGLSASVGAGISMGFTEAVHDDGKLTGRGSPLKRGLACGLMTTLGGLGHTLPYLIKDFRLATAIAFLLVFVELWAIAWIQNRFMHTPFWRATLQVVLGGALVFAAGVLIGIS